MFDKRLSEKGKGWTKYPRGVRTDQRIDLIHRFHANPTVIICPSSTVRGLTMARSSICPGTGFAKCRHEWSHPVQSFTLSTSFCRLSLLSFSLSRTGALFPRVPVSSIFSDDWSPIERSSCRLFLLLHFEKREQGFYPRLNEVRSSQLLFTPPPPSVPFLFPLCPMFLFSQRNRMFQRESGKFRARQSADPRYRKFVRLKIASRPKVGRFLRVRHAQPFIKM